jgi:SAM-dependent methyltransferase
MDFESWSVRRSSFGGVAEVYDRTRPDYPAAALEWLLGGQRRRVLDLGAGTGKLTRMLVAAGHEVVAVDPSAEMLASLRAAVPGAATLTGTAEDIPLGDGDVDAIVVGQAYHWFDTERAHPEMARVLRPGGIVGLLWNLRDESRPWVAALSELLVSEDSTGYVEDIGLPDLGPDFNAAERATFGHVQRLDTGGLVGLMRSRSHVALLPEAAREALLARVAELTRTHPDLAGRAEFELPYVTEVVRAVRRSPTPR